MDSTVEPAASGLGATVSEAQSTIDRGYRRFRWRWLVASVVFALLGAGGWYGWKYYYADNAPQERVNTVTVRQGDLEDVITATGILQPRDFVDVGDRKSTRLNSSHT